MEACKGERNYREQNHLFLLCHCNNEARQEAVKYLRSLGVKAITVHSNCAIFGVASNDQVYSARQCGIFSGVFSKSLSKETIEKLSKEQQSIVNLWNFMRTENYKKVVHDVTNIDKSWNAKDRDAPLLYTIYEAEDFKRILKEKLNICEDALLKDAKQSKHKLKRMNEKEFLAFEKKLEKKYNSATIAYHLVRIAYRLDPVYYDILLEFTDYFVNDLFNEKNCWILEGEISVGVVFVESSQRGGPVFTSNERSTLRARILNGLSWLSEQSPTDANLTWVMDWQFTTIDVANGVNGDAEDYWRDPGLEKINYEGNTYTGEWDSIAEYRNDMRVNNRSAHSIVIFVTPYANGWFAYAGGTRVTLANNNNWGGWGFNGINEVTAHEVCHLFGVADEYTGAGTPCSSCTTIHGCYNIPNGNCGACARPAQKCVMISTGQRLCPYTQGHLGWSDLFVELSTADASWAGTDDTVTLDIGDRTFVLDTPNHDDRERNNVEGYALNYTGVTKEQIKRIGIRKSSDGYMGGWKLARVRLWCRGELICDYDNINKWFEDDERFWLKACGDTESDIINELKINVTTSNSSWSGTDDDVRIYLGGRSWHLDNSWRDDFENGNTDTFKLDPGVGLYRSMLNSIRIYKSPDGFSGGWKLKGLQIFVNGSRIYNNQSINKWLENDERDWNGTI